MSIQVCRDISDAVALYLPQRLYLKSFAKLNISVQLPAPKVHGKSLSNWELMEKLRKLIQPDGFSLLKVTKHSSEVIRFDAELENRQKLERVLSRLEDRIVQLNDYPDPLKVKVSEAKSDFPNRHAWDSFFRDASDMDEMKPGERPDTIHIKNLPIRWFVHERDRDEDATPSESLFKKVFEKYGSVRQVDVPVADPFRMQMKAQMRGITTPPQESELYFEGYLQYAEYASFIRCMDALRGCKLLRKNEDISEWCNIYVEFDKTKHMTDASVKRRAIVRERLAMRQKAKDVEERKEKEKLAKREAKERQKMENLEQEKVAKMREREERRKKKQLAKLMGRDDVDLNKQITEEKKKLLKTQKRLQAVRLIEELFQRLELRPELHNRHNPQRYYNVSERTRQQAVTNIKRLSEKAVEEQREQLQQALDGRIIIRSALETKKPKQDSSISSISDEERSHGHKRVKAERISPERDLYGKPGVYAYPNPYFGYPVSVPPYHYPQSMSSLYYPWRPDARRRGRGRGRARGRMPYFDGPDANRQYYQYFKKLSEFEHRNDHDNRTRSRSRSRSRSRRRSYSRSRSRSRRRSYTRSRSRSRRRSRSRSRRSRSRSRRSRSRSHRQGSSNRRSRSHSRSNSKSRRRSKSKSRRSKSRSKRTPTPKQIETTNGSRPRSKSWSLPKDTRKSWSKTPEKLLQ